MERKHLKKIQAREKIKLARLSEELLNKLGEKISNFPIHFRGKNSFRKYEAVPTEKHPCITFSCKIRNIKNKTSPAKCFLIVNKYDSY